MSTEEDKAKQRRIFEEVINKGELAVAGELVAPDYIYHGPIGMEFKGPEGLKQLISVHRNAFPDLHVTIEDMVAVGSMVVSRFTARGTHKGDLMGIAPTGKPITITGIVIARWVDGKDVEAWESLDMLGMMQQLGVVPSMG